MEYHIETMMSNNRVIKHTIPQYLTIPNIMKSHTPLTYLLFNL